MYPLAGRESILILRGATTYDPETRSDVLLDGQPFYSKKNKKLYIGDGNTPIKQLDSITDPIEKEIAPLTDEEIDNLWGAPGIGEVPTFSMTEGHVPVWNGATFEYGISLEQVASTEYVDNLVGDIASVLTAILGV